jgi:opacity protein-like surface antigen
MRRFVLGAMAACLCASALGAQSPSPRASDNAPGNAAWKSADVETTTSAASGANSFTEGQARERIGKAGFTDVSQLAKDKDGLWQGVAKRDGKPVNVALDYKGNVTSK